MMASFNIAPVTSNSQLCGRRIGGPLQIVPKSDRKPVPTNPAQRTFQRVEEIIRHSSSPAMHCHAAEGGDGPKRPKIIGGADARGFEPARRNRPEVH